MREKFDREKFRPEIYKMFDRALGLRDEDKLDEAIDLLQEIIVCCPEFPFAYAHLGEIFKRQGKLEEANRHFQETARLIPFSQLASLGVFHTFWQMEMYESALIEIKRFRQAGGTCQDYDDIVAELIEKKVINENLNLL